jgi:hypothetical protein
MHFTSHELMYTPIYRELASCLKAVTDSPLPSILEDQIEKFWVNTRSLRIAEFEVFFDQEIQCLFTNKKQMNLVMSFILKWLKKASDNDFLTRFECDQFYRRASEHANTYKSQIQKDQKDLLGTGLTLELLKEIISGGSDVATYFKAFVEYQMNRGTADQLLSASNLDVDFTD